MTTPAPQLDPQDFRFGYCGLPGCWATYEQPTGPGRPRRYCSDEHRRAADTMRKQATARIEHMRELLRRDEHLLAALGGNDA